MATSEPRQLARPLISHAHVLVVEDNPVNEEVACEFLLSTGCTVDVARNGRDAIAAWNAGAFDLVLMDCQMPEMDGLTATTQIRAIEKQTGRSRVPIIAVTAHAYAQDRANCLAAGMDDYLSKPFAEDDLVTMLTRWLESADGSRLSDAICLERHRPCPRGDLDHTRHGETEDVRAINRS